MPDGIGNRLAKRLRLQDDPRSFPAQVNKVIDNRHGFKATIEETHTQNRQSFS
jgi:hypothetical protein